VPGSFELPQAAGHLAATGRFAGIVCVGVVIRGQTPHFEHIAREAAAGIRQVALEYGVPATFGVITSLTEEQAWARAGGEVGNRGEEAAEAALQMAEWVRSIQNSGAAGRSPARGSRTPAAERASRGHVYLDQATRGTRRPLGPRSK
jgi:6,7-dimethyl-8-ribityllumazine synthase